MKKIVRGTTLILYCIFLLLKAASQTDARLVIKKICSAYNTTHTIRFSGTMKMYRKDNPAKIIETMTSNYTIHKANFTCSMGPVKMLLNDRYYVSADKSIKLLMIGNRKDLPGTGQAPVLNTSQFKKWIDDAVIESKVVPGAKIAVLQLKDTQGISGYHFYRITYDNITGYINKVLLETADDYDISHKTMVLEINYTKPVTIAYGQDLFSEKNFFSVKGAKLRIASDYKKYQLINQL